MGEDAKKFGIKLIRELRNMGVKAEMDTLARNIKGQFKYADRLGAQYTIVIGDNELESGTVQLKNMETGDLTDMSLDSLADEFSSVAIRQSVSKLSDELGTSEFANLDLSAIIGGNF